MTKAKWARKSDLLIHPSSPSLECDAVGDVEDDSTDTKEAEALTGVRQEPLRRRGDEANIGRGLCKDTPRRDIASGT